MKVVISQQAQDDLLVGYRFYELQHEGVGDVTVREMRLEELGPIDDYFCEPKRADLSSARHALGAGKIK